MADILFDDAEYWDLFWEERLRGLENQGKREAILAASRLLRARFQQTGRPARVLELGCGEGQIVGALFTAHPALCDRSRPAGLDANPRALARCRRDYPALRFVQGDLTDPALLGGLGAYDLVLLVNVIHEVFSSTVSPDTGVVDVPRAKQRAGQALAGAAGLLAPDGWLLLFDGLEPAGAPEDRLRVRFIHSAARRDFDQFASQYRPFHITFTETGDRLCVELSRHDFARYMTKSIFLGKELWERERFESYQYFTEADFCAAFAGLGLELAELRPLSENEEKWRQRVLIETKGEEFPFEHILILARRRTNS
jgi:SAM-dependent methyltransferase